MRHIALLAMGSAAILMAANKDAGAAGSKAPAAPETVEAPVLEGNELLSAIAASMQNAEAPYYMGTQPELAAAIEAGFVEVNPDLVSEDGTRAAARLTEAGSAQLANSGEGDEGEQSIGGTSAYSLDDDIPPPPPVRGGRSAGVYPFADMEIGKSFFVPVTEEMPKPAKTLASTVSSASKKNYAAEGQPEDRRYFTVRSVDETAQGRGKGARVWRIAPPANAAPAA